MHIKIKNMKSTKNKTKRVRCILGKCDTQKLSKVYWYREKSIDIAREFDTILMPDIVSKLF